MKLLGAILHTLLDYPDKPYGRQPPHEGTLAVGYYQDPDDYTRDNWVGIVQPPHLDSGIVRPKEAKLVELCLRERAGGRQTWVFCQMTGKRDVQPRSARLLEREGLRVDILRSSTVDPKEQGDWIARNGRNSDEIISHLKLVSTGLDLFSKTKGGHNVSTIVFYEIGYDFFTASGSPPSLADWPATRLPGLLSLLRGHHATESDGTYGQDVGGTFGQGHCRDQVSHPAGPLGGRKYGFLFPVPSTRSSAGVAHRGRKSGPVSDRDQQARS